MNERQHQGMSDRGLAGHRCFWGSLLISPVVSLILVGCGNQSAIVGDNGNGIGRNAEQYADGGGVPAQSGERDKGDKGDGGPASSQGGQSDPSKDSTRGSTDERGSADDAGAAGDSTTDEGRDSDPKGPDGDGELPTFSCEAVSSQQFDETSMAAYRVSKDVAAQVDAALALMSPAQKAGQMLGVDGTQKNYRDIHRSIDVAVPGLGVVRGFRYRDGSRGVNLDAGQDNRPDDGNNFATVFPTTSLRAASWDVDLERRVGAAIGDETAASKNNVLLAPSMNLVRHPYWGGIQESYGEDAYHVGRMATALAVGIQQYTLACARQFLANNIERNRSRLNATMTEQTLREVYGRHFEMVVQDGGVACVMAAYNLVNGVKVTQNEHLLRDVLKAPIEQNGFGFGGFVLTDWWAMPGDQDVLDDTTAQAMTIEAVAAGTDIELPWTLHYDEGTLANADQAFVEEAARRILTQKFRFNTALDTDPWSKQAPTATLTDGSITAHAGHQALAEEAVLESAVLLVNGMDDAPVLPLSNVANVAVVGLDREFHLASSSVPKSCSLMSPSDNPRSCVFHFATDPALGDRGMGMVNGDPARTVGPYQGIKEVAGQDVSVTSGNSPSAAADADAVVVVVGYTPGDESEEWVVADGGDRSTLDLPAGQNELISSVLDLGKPTVIIIESGSIVNLPWLSHPNTKQATIWAGYPGERGGVALGKLIFGVANFSGKMPMAWPTEYELPPFAETQTVTNMDYFFGYREFDRRKYIDGSEVALVFPFGHGSSYSTFEYANLQVPCESVTKGAVFNVSIDISNVSSVDGDEVAMLFVRPPPKPASVTGERPWKELKSFARVPVPAGQTVTAQLPVRVRDLRRWEGGSDGRWVVDSGEYIIMVGKNAEDAETGNVASLMVVGD